LAKTFEKFERADPCIISSSFVLHSRAHDSSIDGLFCTFCPRASDCLLCHHRVSGLRVDELAILGRSADSPSFALHLEIISFVGSYLGASPRRPRTRVPVAHARSTGAPLNARFTRPAMSCVSAAASGRVVASPLVSACSSRRTVVRASGGVQRRVTGRRTLVLTHSTAEEDLDAQGT
jgi:hypothetical protein